MTKIVDRSLTLRYCKPKYKETMLFSLTYNPVLPNTKEIINKHWHILSINSTFKEIFTNLYSFPQIRKLKTTYRNKHNNSHTKIFLHLPNQPPQVNVPNITPANRFPGRD